MSTSAVPKKIKMNSQSPTKKLQSSCSFLLLISSSLLILLAAASLAEAAIDVFNDDECNYNPMRKPPRFGKRSHNVADLTDGDLLGIDPAALDRATGPGLSSGSGYRPRRSSNCIRGPLRRRTLRGSPADFALANHLKTSGNLKRFLKMTEENAENGNGNARNVGEGENGSGNGNGGVNSPVVEDYILESSGKSAGNSGEAKNGKNGNGSGSRLTDDLLLIARLRARFPKAMRSLEAVVREFKALDTGSAHKDK